MADEDYAREAYAGGDGGNFNAGETAAAEPVPYVGGAEGDTRKRVAAGTIAGNPARKRWRGEILYDGFLFS